MKRNSDHIFDEMLVLQAQQGDNQALTLLVRRWHKKLYGYAYKTTNNSSIAEDIVQESWQAIVKGLKNLKDPALFRPWIYRIVNNKAVDWIRKQQKERSLMEKELKDHKEPMEEDEVPDDALFVLKQALKSLPEDQRFILSMHYLERLSVKHMAKVLDIPEGTVKSRLFNARKYLKKKYEETKQESE
ncbi:RNA polymerase sigma factor [Fulvivirgaceae bacterium BMA10]|uniref:RNA polymerase sigma factor n=1 Tax=Splendidivirga corallicola TaxID=3051826 RepID=A0ABT8KXQ4_9BACT|nr:RNA polymerase sigma factor [Fulvivirgaceae bacterium BMA10]